MNTLIKRSLKEFLKLFSVLELLEKDSEILICFDRNAKYLTTIGTSKIFIQLHKMQDTIEEHHNGESDSLVSRPHLRVADTLLQLKQSRD